jgi:hypothetical protein
MNELLIFIYYANEFNMNADIVIIKYEFNKALEFRIIIVTLGFTWLASRINVGIKNADFYIHSGLE